MYNGTKGLRFHGCVLLWLSLTRSANKGSENHGLVKCPYQNPHRPTSPSPEVCLGFFGRFVTFQRYHSAIQKYFYYLHYHYTDGCCRSHPGIDLAWSSRSNCTSFSRHSPINFHQRRPLYCWGADRQSPRLICRSENVFASCFCLIMAEQRMKEEKRKN